MSLETVVLDAWWKDKTFEGFQRLPPEIRQMIWEESMPARYVNPRPRGSIALPGPPAAAYVCRESRSVAFRFGAPYAIDWDNKHGNSVWFKPTMDIVLYENHPIRFTNRICATSAWNVVQKVALSVALDRWSYKSLNIDHIIKLPELKEVFVIPTGIKYYHRRLADSTKWIQRIKSGVFGNNTYRQVDLDDLAQVSQLCRLLHRHRSSSKGSQLLDFAVEQSNQKVCSKTGTQGVKFRDFVTSAFEEAWLGRKHVAFSSRANGTVIKTDDVKQALEDMPTLRFFYVFFDFTDEVPHTEHNGFRYQGNPKDYRPEYVFNHEFKLWQRFVPT